MTREVRERSGVFISTYFFILLYILYLFSGPSPSLFKSKHICLRMFYNVHGDLSYFHTFRTTGTRLFNNMVIHIKNDEEARGKKWSNSTIEALQGDLRG